MKKRILYISGAIIITVIMVYSFSGNDPELVAAKYLEFITNERREKNNFMKRDPSSPFVQSDLDYKGLNYFEPDLRYKVIGKFRELEAGEILKLPTNDGKEEIYQKLGYADFEIEGKECSLLVLKSTLPIQNILFVPFVDSTSGEETYGGGRYIEAKMKTSEKIELDFNLAYNPYCAYVANFSCPLPPKDNYLSIPIYAGEKNYD